MSITFDSWTSNGKKNYVAVTGHYVRNYSLNSCLLSFFEASESHTSEDLAKLLMAKLLKSEVLDVYPQVKFTCCVTDSAANMIKTAKILKIRHIPCFLHRVQTTVNKAITQLSSSKNLVQADNTDENVFDDLEDLSETVELVYFISRLHVISILICTKTNK